MSGKVGGRYSKRRGKRRNKVKAETKEVNSSLVASGESAEAGAEVPH